MDNFYEPDQVALIRVGFRYPGTRKSGDLPPRPECAPRWHLPPPQPSPQNRL